MGFGRLTRTIEDAGCEVGRISAIGFACCDEVKRVWVMAQLVSWPIYNRLYTIQVHSILAEGRPRSRLVNDSEERDQTVARQEQHRTFPGVSCL